MRLCLHWARDLSLALAMGKVASHTPVACLGLGYGPDPSRMGETGCPDTGARQEMVDKG